MKERFELKIINLVSFIFLLVASFIFNRTNMFMTSTNTPLFMPAPYAFGIWGLIYLLLFIWVAGQFFARPSREVIYEKIGYWFAISMVFTGLTILVPVRWSALFIVKALIATIILYQIIDREDTRPVLFRVPISFLLAWLSVATIVNISLVLKDFGVTQIAGLGEVAWTIILLVLGTLLASYFTFKKKDIIYSLVFIWGYIGIAVQNKAIQLIVIAAVIGVVILVGAILYTLFKK